MADFAAATLSREADDVGSRRRQRDCRRRGAAATREGAVQQLLGRSDERATARRQRYWRCDGIGGIGGCSREVHRALRRRRFAEPHWSAWPSRLERALHPPPDLAARASGWRAASTTLTPPRTPCVTTLPNAARKLSDPTPGDGALRRRRGGSGSSGGGVGAAHATLAS